MIGYLFISLFLWLLHLVDKMLLALPYIRQASDVFNNMINYLDLLVLYVRPLMPLTTSLIFSSLSNVFNVYLILIFIGMIKRFIPFFGSTRTLN